MSTDTQNTITTNNIKTYTRRVRKVKIHHVGDREPFMLIIATLPSTFIHCLSAVLVWQW